MLFDRAEKPNTTIEEWGVITRTGLFAHGTDPNPLGKSTTSTFYSTNCVSQSDRRRTFAIVEPELRRVSGTFSKVTYNGFA